jgi:MSHA biogenesis protein MshP
MKMTIFRGKTKELDSRLRGNDEAVVIPAQAGIQFQPIKTLQRGFSLITAIFLLVVIAALGAMMVTFFAAQQQSSAIDLLGSRAYQTARAGMEWGAFQITQSQVAGPSFATACQGGTSSVPTYPSAQPTLTGTPLSQYSLADSCFATQYMEGTNSFWVYTITATSSGVNGATPGSTDYVRRAIQATIASAVSVGDTASGIIYQHERY